MLSTNHPSSVSPSNWPREKLIACSNVRVPELHAEPLHLYTEEQESQGRFEETFALPSMLVGNMHIAVLTL